MPRTWIWGAAGCGLALAGVAALAPGRAADNSFAQVERGRYLAAAGDCVASHTAEGGKPFAGGRPIQTPFGVIYSPNITPDRDTGIGAWSDDDFYRALHSGIDAGGNHLYPAFPYPWYTKATREDVLAIRAFLNTLQPVSNKKPENDLTWPLSYRVVMVGWDALFFTEGTYKPDPSKSEQWNRGAYLVEGLGHCGACHTPTNMFGAAEKSDRFRGGNLQDWYAPNLTGDLRSGLGNWEKNEIVEFLKTGRNSRTAAYGPMAEVVTNSTSKLDDADLEAIATYLKDLPAPQTKEKPKAPDQAAMKSGEAIYVDSCSACHMMGGEGVPGTFPPLKGDSVAQSEDPTTMIRLILHGGRAVPTDARPTPLSMPAFDWKLSDSEIAAVATYVRNAWGNAAKPVSESKVSDLRKDLRSASRSGE